MTKSFSPLSSASTTLIGPNMQVAGRVEFCGTLRVAGKVVGDVIGQTAPEGLPSCLIVESTGTINGHIEAPDVVLRGTVNGDLHSSQRIEVSAGGHITGELHYAQLQVDTGAELNSSLHPQSNALPQGAPPLPRVTTQNNPWPRRRILAIVAVPLLIGGLYLGGAQQTRSPTIVPQVVEPSAAAGVSLVAPATPMADATPAPTEKQAVAPITPPRQTIQIIGALADRPTTMIYVVSRQGAVLRRSRKAEDAGVPVTIPGKTNMSVSIAPGELIRLDEGNDIEIFYQGKKVPPVPLTKGHWIKFVPATP